ncbi:B-type cell cycle switch protein ccs52A-like [Amaranthus tricolor]|uniref:B-type cell cycle switch protein ccs52A-like n=1 Tax=Amaranthus tricolor TaxID=29722 RepID=UPI00258AD0FD|nr:B-type cell cycle switch protein ccs52A-like [Amaranthus tricolor]
MAEDLTSLPPLQSSKPPLLINYPSKVARPSLSLDNMVDGPITPSRTIDRMINSHHYPSPSRTILSDRFIPSRSSSNFSLFNVSPSSSFSSSPQSNKQPDGTREESNSTYTSLLRAALFGPDAGCFFPGTPDKGLPNRNIFRFKSETKRPLPSLMPFGPDDALPGVTYRPAKIARKVPRSPYKVLDAPSLQDDFYLNLVDWSSHNVLSVGLANCVYLWNACSSKVTKLCDVGIDDSVCSVGWAQRGTHLAVGTNNGKVQIWDVSRSKRIRTMDGHRLRVGAVAWSSSVLASGSRDKNIFLRDVRAQEDYVSKLTGHKSEVCGLKWSYDNRELASGGNDNRLFVWNQHSTQPVLRYSEHTAAVKAIAWSPHLHGLLASGGGTADRCIRFWNTTTNSQLGCMDTGSQVCNLVWSKNVNELVSTHGYSQNQIIVWRYPTMSKLATLTGHAYRVLYLAVSPDGQNIVTGAGDETLRFWSVFPSSKSQNTDTEVGFHSLGRTRIR